MKKMNHFILQFKNWHDIPYSRKQFLWLLRRIVGNEKISLRLFDVYYDYVDLTSILKTCFRSTYLRYLEEGAEKRSVFVEHVYLKGLQ